MYYSKVHFVKTIYITTGLVLHIMDAKTTLMVSVLNLTGKLFNDYTYHTTVNKRERSNMLTVF